ncbi:MAG: hypothetical protein ACYCV4_07370 [Dermatophilaceae bacterium]
MRDVIDIVVVEEDEGYAAFSPQLPGFAYGRPTLTEFKKELAGAVRFAGGAKQIRVHMEKHTWDEGGREVVVRWAEDEHRDERLEVAKRIYAALTVSEQRERLLDSATDRTGAVVFVCAVSGDTLGRFADQLDEAGNALVIAVAVADELVWTSQMGSTGAHPDWVSLASMGASLATTVGEWVSLVGTQRFGNKVLVSV